MIKHFLALPAHPLRQRKGVELQTGCKGGPLPNSSPVASALNALRRNTRARSLPSGPPNATSAGPCFAPESNAWRTYTLKNPAFRDKVTRKPRCSANPGCPEDCNFSASACLPVADTQMYMNYRSCFCMSPASPPVQPSTLLTSPRAGGAAARCPQCPPG